MNFNVVRHLLSADFRTLRPLIFITWILMLFSAVEGLLTDPDNFDSYPGWRGSHWGEGTDLNIDYWEISSDQAPWWKNHSQRSGRVKLIFALAGIAFVVVSFAFISGRSSRPFDWQAEPWRTAIPVVTAGFVVLQFALVSLRFANLISYGCGIILALLIGCIGIRWHGTRPVRRRELVASKLLLILTSLTLPQILLIVATLVHNELAAQYVFKGVVASAASILPLHLFLCAAGALQRSFVRVLASAAALIAVAAMAAIILPFEGRIFSEMMTPLTDFWARKIGPRQWAYLWVLLTLIALLLWLRAGRWSNRHRLIATLGVVVASWFMTRTIDDRYLHADDIDALEVSFENTEIVPPPSLTAFPKLGIEPVADLRGVFRSEDLPGDVSVRWWRSGETKLLINGEIGARAESQKFSDAPLTPPFVALSIEESLKKALPAGARFPGEKYDGVESSDTSHLGKFVTTDLLDLEAQRFTLETDMIGIAYRSEVLGDVLVEQGGSIDIHGVQMMVRKCATYRGAPVIDTVRIRPALRVDGSTVHASWKRSYIKRWQAFLYLPKPNLIFGLDSAYTMDAPLLTGAGVTREMFQPRVRRAIDDEQTLDATGARFLVVAPKTVGVSRRKVTIPNLSVRFRRTGSTDFYYTCAEHRNAKTLMIESRSKRPGPQTASAEELGAWLRESLKARTQEWRTYDLAEFAPRHVGILLRTMQVAAGNFSEIDDAIALGALEGDRDIVLDAGLYQPIIKRGWMEPGREVLLDEWRRGRSVGTEGFTRGLLALEEPETLPAFTKLINARYITVETYEKVRMLPGIEPNLDGAIEALYEKHKVIGDPPPADGRDQREANRNRISRLLVPAKHGLRAAMLDAMKLYRSSQRRNIHTMTPILSNPATKRKYWSTDDKAWLDALDPETLEWDSLTRMWKLPAKKSADDDE